mmetsp:Transcript_20025/g.9298  ORF Transcript_20025/g.9298 Transcript_20025/m.9298 type:complete len:88 (-) Transcript_20025:337-600(-)
MVMLPMLIEVQPHPIKFVFFDRTNETVTLHICFEQLTGIPHIRKSVDDDTGYDGCGDKVDREHIEHIEKENIIRRHTIILVSDGRSH